MPYITFIDTFLYLLLLLLMSVFQFHHLRVTTLLNSFILCRMHSQTSLIELNGCIAGRTSKSH